MPWENIRRPHWGHCQILIFPCKTNNRELSFSHVTCNPEVGDSRLDSFNSLIMSERQVMSPGFPPFSLYGHKMASTASKSIHILTGQKGRAGRRVVASSTYLLFIMWENISQNPPCSLQSNIIGVDWITYLLLNQSLAKGNQISVISLNQIWLIFWNWRQALSSLKALSPNTWIILEFFSKEERKDYCWGNNQQCLPQSIS